MAWEGGGGVLGRMRCVWQGLCVVGGGGAYKAGACMVVGCAWPCVKNASRQCASYWNAFLFFDGFFLFVCHFFCLFFDSMTFLCSKCFKALVLHLHVIVNVSWQIRLIGNRQVNYFQKIFKNVSVSITWATRKAILRKEEVVTSKVQIRVTAARAWSNSRYWQQWTYLFWGNFTLRGNFFASQVESTRSLDPRVHLSVKHWNVTSRGRNIYTTIENQKWHMGGDIIQLTFGKFVPSMNEKKNWLVVSTFTDNFCYDLIS